jgi:hypothetical protein
VRPHTACIANMAKQRWGVPKLVQRTREVSTTTAYRIADQRPSVAPLTATARTVPVRPPPSHCGACGCPSDHTFFEA